MGWFTRRRARRTIRRLTVRIRHLRDEIDQMEQELATVAHTAEEATIDAAVRQGAPVAREARRARASHTNLARLLGARRGELVATIAERDDALERLAAN